MQQPTDRQIEGLLIGIISDGFNRSLKALEDAGAVDTKVMMTDYQGIGSRYYDLVTVQIEIAATHGARAVRQLFEGTKPD